MKKAPKSPKFIGSSDKDEEKEGLNKKKKMSPLLGVKEESQSVFDLRKGSKSQTIEKEVKRVVFMRRPYKGQESSNVALYNTKYLRRVLKMSGVDKKTKDFIKKHRQRPDSF